LKFKYQQQKEPSCNFQRRRGKEEGKKKIHQRQTTPPPLIRATPT